MLDIAHSYSLHKQAGKKLKFVSAIFYEIFIFHQMIVL